MNDGGLVDIGIVLQSALLFTLISIAMEKIMMVFYTRFNMPSIVRQIIIIAIGTGLYSMVALVAKPWSITKFLFKLPAFIFAILPMFVVFSIIFEQSFKREQKKCDEKLELIKNHIK
jgi:hypothetical protein